MMAVSGVLSCAAFFGVRTGSVGGKAVCSCDGCDGGDSCDDDGEIGECGGGDGGVPSIGTHSHTSTQAAPDACWILRRLPARLTTRAEPKRCVSTCEPSAKLAWKSSMSCVLSVLGRVLYCCPRDLSF